MTGIKHDEGKLEFHQLPIKPLQEVIKVLMYGARKYGSDTNWQRVDNPKQRYSDATMRHMMAYMDGELIDNETGLSHLAHAAADILFLLHFELEKIEDELSRATEIYHTAMQAPSETAYIRAPD